MQFFTNPTRTIGVGITEDPDRLLELIRREFDQSNPNWDPRPEHNEHFLKATRLYLSDKLVVTGVLLLNDVYDSLGFPRSALGALLGWKRGQAVLFGNLEDTGGSIVLDFNVSGGIVIGEYGDGEQ